jgi:hypothetical protein
MTLNFKLPFCSISFSRWGKKSVAHAGGDVELSIIASSITTTFQPIFSLKNMIN